MKIIKDIKQWEEIGIFDGLSDIEKLYLKKHIDEIEFSNGVYYEIDNINLDLHAIMILPILRRIIVGICKYDENLIERLENNNLIQSFNKFINIEYDILHKYFHNLEIIYNTQCIDIDVNIISTFCDNYINGFLAHNINLDYDYVRLNKNFSWIDLYINKDIFDFTLLKLIDIDVIKFNDTKEYLSNTILKNNGRSIYDFKIIRNIDELIELFENNKKIQDIIIENKNKEFKE